jgi:hypothetical protein
MYVHSQKIRNTNKMNCELMLTYDTPAYMFNVYKNQLSPKTLPTIWHTYMKLVTKYKISAINSCWEKCDEKYLGRTDRGKTAYPLRWSGGLIIHKSLEARKLKGLNNIGQNLIRLPLPKEIVLSTMWYDVFEDKGYMFTSICGCITLKLQIKLTKRTYL